MLIALLLTITLAPAGQDETPQKLFESGKYQEAIDKVKSHRMRRRIRSMCARSRTGS